MPRRFPIFQVPNPPLIVAMLAGGIAATTHGALSRNAQLLTRLALLVWSAEEITTGANWFRRLLGLAGGVYGLAKVASTLGAVNDSSESARLIRL
jgi:hypothetical protein